MTDFQRIAIRVDNLMVGENSEPLTTLKVLLPQYYLPLVRELEKELVGSFLVLRKYQVLLQYYCPRGEDQSPMRQLQWDETHRYYYLCAFSEKALHLVARDHEVFETVWEIGQPL